MNFSTVRGYNAYAQFTAKIRESVRLQEPPKEPSQEKVIKRDKTDSLFSDPVDVVTISHSARARSMSIMAERETAQNTLKEWIRESGGVSGVLTHRVSGQVMADLLSGNGISLDEDEAYSINVDVWCAVTVTGKNAEKAKAIQDLLNSTPSGINWGFLLQKLPIKA